MPLIFDNIVVFLVYVLIEFIQSFSSRNWAITTGTVEDTYSENGMYPYAKVNYAYGVNGESYFGSYRRGFFYRDSARFFARNIPSSTVITIRYRSDKPDVSRLRAADQASQWGESRFDGRSLSGE